MRSYSITVIATLLVSVLAAAPAQAQVARTFVSAAGSDSNNCANVATPCRHFQSAVSVTTPGGEVIALDPANYGAITITHPITIYGNGWAAISGASGGAAIVVNTFGTTSVVALHGLILEGQQTATDGVLVEGTGRIEIFDCVIRNFTHDGIYFTLGQFGGTNPNTVLVSNTITVDNGSAGIEVAPNNPFLARGVITNVKTAGNGGSGILVDGTLTGTGAFVDVQLSDIVSDSNGGDGITVRGTGDVKVDIRNSISSNNGGNGLSVSNARVSISNNALVQNTNSGFSNSGTLFSFLDNVIENNRLANVGTTTTDAKQ